MTDNFSRYFKGNLLLFGGIGLVVSIARLLARPGTSFLLLTGVMFFFVLLAFAIAWLNYRFFKKQAPEINASLQDKAPLRDFKTLGFVKDAETMLTGSMEGYYITLSPLAAPDRINSLVILIPVNPAKDSEINLPATDDFYTLRLTGTAIFAEAIIKNYDRLYDFDGLVKLISNIIKQLKERNIRPAQVIEEME